MAMGNSARVEMEDPRPGLVNKWKRLLKLEVIWFMIYHDHVTLTLYRVTSVLWDYILLTSFECSAVCLIRVGQLLVGGRLGPSARQHGRTLKIEVHKK